MGTLRGFPNPPVSALRRAKPAFSLPLEVALVRLPGAWILLDASERASARDLI